MRWIVIFYNFPKLFAIFFYVTLNRILTSSLLYRTNFTRKEKCHDVHRIPIKFKKKFNWRQSFTSSWALAKTSKIVQTKSCSTWQNTRFNFLDFGTLNFSEVNTSSHFLSISLAIVVFCYPFATILRDSNC